MTVFDIFTLLGGLAFFLFGMRTMSGALERVAGGKLESILRAMTDKPIKGLALGTIITAIVQSSSAVTVMLVGLVNSGLLKLGQCIGVLMGSNIGTTLTAWILSLAGIESDHFLLKMLKPTSFSPLVALIGIILMMVSKKDRVKNIGAVMMGFAVLMYGMTLMSGATAPLAESAAFDKLIVLFSNPLLGLLIGIVITAVVQSSAATIGILQALSLTGGITYHMAIPIIMGENIGTCVTSLLSSIGANKNAKRVVAVHIYIKVIGTAFYLTLYFLLYKLIGFGFAQQAAAPVGIAVVHSIFNVATTVLLFPFIKLLEKLAIKTIPDKNAPAETTFLDERLLNSPALAVAECRNHTVDMAHLAADTLRASLTLLTHYDRKTAETILRNEEQLDEYEDHLGTYMVKLTGCALSAADSDTISTLLHTIGDFERIGDHAVNLLKTAEEIQEKKLDFSDAANTELQIAANAIREILGMTTDAFCENDLDKAMLVEPLEQVIDELTAQIKDHHIHRLTGGQSTIEHGFVLGDLLTNFERVSDHCSNIAVCIIQIHRSVFDTHEYLNDYKAGENSQFTAVFHDYAKKYALPAD
ncbi:MAG: Na/Pi cotransporter family protein [Clostridia bacterium]|nr:Na/Pi cotransporter family protein [Clostridia bacterium]